MSKVKPGEKALRIATIVPNFAKNISARWSFQHKCW